MKKIFITVFIIIVLGAGYWFISPLFTEKVVQEDLPIVATTQVEQVSKIENVKQGSFTGFDRSHNGSGTAKIITIDGKHFIRFENDFVVTNGPDLYVGLGANGEYLKMSELGKLKGNKGSQNYELPFGMNPEDIKEVWIWCKAFSVPFAKAVLQ